MSSRVERFKKRQKIKKSHTVYEEVDSGLVDTFLNSKVNKERVKQTLKNIEDFHDVSVSAEEAKQFLSQFKKDFNDARFEQLISDCRKDVINSIVTPFGLGNIVAAYDKTGGNVDTIHNVRLDIYAAAAEKEAYKNRGKYESNEYHGDQEYRRINKHLSHEKKAGNANDYLTGGRLTPNYKTDSDHIVSAKSIHDDKGRVLAEIEGKDLANVDSNLKLTDSGLNRSKKADTMDNFLARNKKLIRDLEDKGSLTKKEQHKLNKLKSVDEKKAQEEYDKANKEINNKINTKYYTGSKFAKKVLSSGGGEAAKMGIQQAIGLVMTEFFAATFDEITDIYKNGVYKEFDDTFFIVLKERLSRIADKLRSKWKNVIISFKDGTISGFLSNLVTVITNAFITTGKRAIRIIREVIYSLFKAIKILLFPPEGMSFEDRMHEAKKIIASGLIISLGFIVEQYIDTLIKGTAILEPFADALTTILVGAITGLIISMVVYYLDKKKNDKDAISEMVKQTEKAHENIVDMLTISPPKLAGS